MASGVGFVQKSINICHSLKLLYTRNLIPKGQDNWLPEATVIASLIQNQRLNVVKVAAACTLVMQVGGFATNHR